MIRFFLLGLLTFAFLFTAAAAQNNWPRFRGPNADGVAPDNAALPTTWSDTDNVAWAADVPGWGWSCPIVWGDRVFVTSVVSEEENLTPSKGLYLGQGVREPAKGIHHWMVHCFDLNTGKEIWKHVSGNAKQPGSGSTPLNTAAVFGQTAVAKLLIEKGADPSIANTDGSTALHIASFFTHADFVQLLLDKGASINVKNRRGEAPLDVVSAKWNPQLEGIYRSIGDLIGIELDLERIKQTRPKIADLLREKAEKDTNKRSDASVPPLGSWRRLPDRWAGQETPPTTPGCCGAVSRPSRVTERFC